MLARSGALQGKDACANRDSSRTAALVDQDPAEASLGGCPPEGQSDQSGGARAASLETARVGEHVASMVDGSPGPLRIVNAAAPIRICDNGGWTDTWFAGHGKVFNIGVHPSVEAQVRVYSVRAHQYRVVLDAQNYGERYGFDPGALPNRHPMLEAVVDDVGLPDDVSVEISVYSQVPAGCSTGTSAAVAVALIGALDSLTSGRMTRREVAYAAHRIEVDRLGNQSGIQDQICAAYGGINFIEMPSYPHASVSQLAIADSAWWELERRLALVLLGRSHVSSEVHARVIQSLEQGADASVHLEELRRDAEDARYAVSEGDFRALGSAMARNTDAQRRLHPGLVSPQAETVIEAARANGALGWKVNGAGGEGGSITLLCSADTRRKRRLLHAVTEEDPLLRIVPIHLSRNGLRVWQAPVP